MAGLSNPLKSSQAPHGSSEQTPLLQDRNKDIDYGLTVQAGDQEVYPPPQECTEGANNSVSTHVEPKNVADNAKQGFTVPPNASSSNEEAQPTKSQKKKWIFCFILGFVLIVFALSIAITPVGVVLPCKCQGIKPTSPIKGGDTILVAELTQCQKPPNISLVHQDGRTRINDISVFFTSCDNLHIYVINFTYSFVEISTPIHWLLDKDQDNYFLPNTQVNITLNIYSDTTNETLVVCLLNFRDHDRLQQSTTVGERLDVVKEKNCTEIRSNSLSFSKTIEKAAHYFVAIVSLTDAAPDSLKGDYNVSISRHFYNHSDFQTDEKCTGLSSRKHCIEDFNSSSNCIVLYAAIDPEGTFFDNVSTVAEAVPFTERHELIIPTIVLPILGICVLIIAIVSVCYCMNRYRKEL